MKNKTNPPLPYAHTFARPPCLYFMSCLSSIPIVYVVRLTKATTSTRTGQLSLVHSLGGWSLKLEALNVLFQTAEELFLCLHEGCTKTRNYFLSNARFSQKIKTNTNTLTLLCFLSDGLSKRFAQGRVHRDDDVFDA